MSPRPSSTAHVRVALTGAAGMYGRSALMQFLHHPRIHPSLVCDLDVERTAEHLRTLGVPSSDIVLATSAAQVRDAAGAGKITVVPDVGLIASEVYDVLVEATGVVRPGLAAAEAAIAAQRHVVMVSKETDATFGAYLSVAAQRQSVVYTIGAGDQPANLVALAEWGQRLGLEIVAAGKSSEYDLIHDPASGMTSLAGHREHLPALAQHWSLGDDLSSTLDRRARAIAAFDTRSAADACEATLMASYTGMTPDRPDLHYPLVRIPEIADVYAPRAAGGILRSEGVIDVFTLLRAPSEPSFAGGVFIVVRCHDRTVWEMLAEKGHIVSRDREYACIGLPFHFMGVEVAGTVLDAACGGRVPERTPGGGHLMVARTSVGRNAGEVLRVAGHHHEIAGTSPEIVPFGSPAVPYHLLDGLRLTRDLAPGALVTFADVDGVTDRERSLLDH